MKVSYHFSRWLTHSKLILRLTKRHSYHRSFLLEERRRVYPGIPHTCFPVMHRRGNSPPWGTLRLPPRSWPGSLQGKPEQRQSWHLLVILTTYTSTTMALLQSSFTLLTVLRHAWWTCWRRILTASVMSIVSRMARWFGWWREHKSSLRIFGHASTARHTANFETSIRSPCLQIIVSLKFWWLWAPCIVLQQLQLPSRTRRW